MEAPVVLLFKSRGWWGPTHGGTHIKQHPEPGHGGGSTHAEHGPFGPVFRQFRRNPEAAIKHLIKVKDGEAISALYHRQLGEIDLVWGFTTDDKRAKGFGLAKLIKWHPEVLDDLQGFIDSLHVHQVHKGHAHLTDGVHGRAGIRLDFDGKTKHWLVTAYDVAIERLKKSDGEGASAGSSASGGLGDGTFLATPSSTLAETIHQPIKKSIATVVVFKRTAQG